ncbi:hypothetical protein DID77_04610, partial [Candidatus Marinamargulisbacteria bacterium SCGC AG-439-L15]
RFTRKDLYLTMRKRVFSLLLIVFISVAMVMGVSYYTDKQAEKVLKGAKHGQYQVKGMFCESCDMKIENTLLSLKGVHKVSVDRHKESVVVLYTEGDVSSKQVVTAIESLGYQVKLTPEKGKLEIINYKVTY